VKDASAFATVEARGPGFAALVSILTVILLAGLWAAHNMESQGHHITGMNNQVVWGIPHVFAVFLIVAASGSLNVASLSSVFGRTVYGSLARLSALLAIALLLGGLAVLVLDLGRPDRLIVAMTYYNFKSIFAWNIFLYTGFIVIAGVYIWFMMEQRFQGYSKPVGFLAFVWRLTLTSGTGSIFGFLVARQAYDAAVMAPMFVAMSLAFGTAVFLIALLTVSRVTARPVDKAVLDRQARLLTVFVVAVLYFVVIFHVTQLYAAEHRDIVRFLLLDGNHPYARLFWIGQIALGSVLPLALLWTPRVSRSPVARLVAACLIVLGGLVQLYVIIIGGQAYPLVLFPGYDVSSTFFDGVVGQYSGTVNEFLLGIGGVALAILVVTLSVRVLPIVPNKTPAVAPDRAAT
jgi:molybdopterin-containing oxidoreductase family membrane subunit